LDCPVRRGLSERLKAARPVRDPMLSESAGEAREGGRCAAAMAGTYRATCGTDCGETDKCRGQGRRSAACYAGSSRLGKNSTSEIPATALVREILALTSTRLADGSVKPLKSRAGKGDGTWFWVIDQPSVAYASMRSLQSGSPKQNWRQLPLTKTAAHFVAQSCRADLPRQIRRRAVLVQARSSKKKKNRSLPLDRCYPFTAGEAQHARNPQSSFIDDACD